MLEDRNTEPETSAEEDLEDRNQREPERTRDTSNCSLCKEWKAVI